MTYATVANQTHTQKFGLAAPAVRMLETLWTWRDRAQARAETRRLLERGDDRMLADIGVTRAMLVDASGRPFWRA